MNNETQTQPRSQGSTPIRVLMADPDALLGPLYGEPLARDGFELVTAANGLECVSRLREQTPDVLVLEPHMPWGGGDGVLAMMGDIPDLAHLPVMVLTSCRDPGRLTGVARFPINDFHVKPLAPERLAGRLRNVLAHPRLRFTLADPNGRLKCLIARRTDGGVCNLRVETVDGRVLVSGCAQSYSAKQLINAALQEAFEATQAPLRGVELDIELCSDCHSTAPESCFHANRSWETVR